MVTKLMLIFVVSIVMSSVLLFYLPNIITMSSQHCVKQGNCYVTKTMSDIISQSKMFSDYTTTRWDKSSDIGKHNRKISKLRESTTAKYISQEMLHRLVKQLHQSTKSTDNSIKYRSSGLAMKIRKKQQFYPPLTTTSKTEPVETTYRSIHIDDSYVNETQLKDISWSLYDKVTRITSRHQCFNNVTHHYINEQLVQIKHPELIDNLLKQVKSRGLTFSKLEISEKQSEFLIICDNRPKDKEPLMVLFTTMYHRRDKQFMFYNTVKNWAILSDNLHPVLFIADTEITEKSGILISEACSKGWTVTYTAHCNKHNYPLLNSMFIHVKTLLPSATWYGFCNADILFDNGLIQTMEFLQQKNVSVQFAAARRWNTYIEPHHTIDDITEVMKLKTSNSELYMAWAIDLFIFKKDMVPIANMPPFVIGRPGYDNWLMHHTASQNFTSVDITYSANLIHQSMKGYTAQENSHKTINKSANFNLDLIPSIGDLMKTGSIMCIPYYTGEKKINKRDIFVLSGPTMTNGKETKLQLFKRRTDQLCMGDNKSTYKTGITRRVKVYHNNTVITMY